MTEDEEKVASELFKVGDKPPPHTGELRTHLTVRFDQTRPGIVYYGPHLYTRKVRIPGATVISYSLVTAPGPKVRTAHQSVLIRTADGRKWQGNPKPGTDVIVLKLKRERRRKKDG
jgi:hypothetical protein